MILPLARSGEPVPYGFVVLGVSPTREFDDAYKGFIDLIADHQPAGAKLSRHGASLQFSPKHPLASDLASGEFFLVDSLAS